MRDYLRGCGKKETHNTYTKQNIQKRSIAVKLPVGNKCSALSILVSFAAEAEAGPKRRGRRGLK